MRARYHPPVKRSVEIAGHKTSVSLEPLFWDMLKQAALEEGVPVNALVARIDAERIEAETPPGLASAIRVWLVAARQSWTMPDHEAGIGDADGQAQSPPTRSTSAPSSDSFSSSRS